MDIKLPSHITGNGQGILFLGSAGTGENKILSESQMILEKTTRSMFL